MRNLLINRRKELGLTQEDLAKQIGRRRNTVSSYESGVLNPSLEVAIKIKNALKVENDEIFLKQNVILNDKNDVVKL